ncbi:MULTISPECIES: hypothetical protein [Staphylococcus]|jgi:hypothetical protein|uniref:Uncharacterized protein n=1 Tax=Staphylococcus hominis TaxID=1290 RepID=A0A3S7GSJ1_STAHO|nr:MULTISPECIES: hypothetical protein [Staphylococcus]EUZ70269.1 hypothetical protein O552_00176 [Staphylococcus sp. M0480]OFM59993.1 hypothetical protein HMPREF2677_09790 [Staphylococcus sp. HMSC059G05]OFM63755.1 hypothetical protein HMPREF2673_08600 [Staphylococcus sp. HMSC062C01]OFM64929.1 hypothetical protein HMPREF2672_05900 [Staphylococcus sp. HMSC068D07]OFM79698.1 hypothetical protein HMPREF2662_05450 [Staphylococcus sp. HMSC074B09]OFM95757.1 hypothetical protein HMPREF2639_01375 [Stap
MSKVKFKRIQEQTIEELENEINQYLASEEGRRYELLNVSIDKIEERQFPNNEEILSAFLILADK